MLIAIIKEVFQLNFIILGIFAIINNCNITFSNNILYNISSTLGGLFFIFLFHNRNWL